VVGFYPIDKDNRYNGLGPIFELERNTLAINAKNTILFHEQFMADKFGGKEGGEI